MASIQHYRKALSLAAVVAAVGAFVAAGPGGPAAATTAITAHASANAVAGAQSVGVAVHDVVDSLDAAPAGFIPVTAVPDRAQVSAPDPEPARAETPAASTATPSGYGCAAALAYLAANAAPGFTFQCPGNAWGHQAMTCVNHAPQCAGQKLITIAVPCAAAYMNEAHNSWVLTGTGSGIDPYGYCH